MGSRDMKSFIQRAYFILGAVFFVLFVLLFFFFRLDVTEQETKRGYEHLTEYEASTEEDGNAPAGIRQRYTFTLKEVDGSYRHLMFYSIHQNVKIYLDNELIYSMKADSIDLTGSSPGCVWNQVDFTPEDNGRQVCIEITPVYESSVDISPTIYFGNIYDITRKIIIGGLPAALLAVVAIVTGIIYIFFILYHNKKSEVEHSILMLGIFAIQVGLWKLADTDLLPLVLPNHPALSQLTFLALMLMCIPFTLFIKDLYSTREKMIWYVPCIASLASMGTVSVLQFFGIADLRQTLFLTHLLILIIVVISVVMAAYEVHTVGWNFKLRRNILCMGICFFGAGSDMLIYYITKGKTVTVLSMIGFVIYIIVLGLSSMQEAKKLMDIGIRAEQYEKMAYHDQLTGLYNRTAYAEYTGNSDFVPDKCIVLMLDLNDLKKCNDSLGHDKGDVYIRKCAEAIRECFGELGRCYRVGGDEFCVIMADISLHFCKQRAEELKEKVVGYKKLLNGFETGIACGYAVYDKRIDYDIYDTVRRADRMMYEEKFAMKHGRTAEK